MYRHWDKQLKELQTQRLARREEGRAESEVLEIPDDDSSTMSIDHLEKKSLEQAHMGIILLDDDYEPLDNRCLDSSAQHDAGKSTPMPEPQSSLPNREELIRQLIAI